jgi:hypothetical protein
MCAGVGARSVGTVPTRVARRTFRIRNLARTVTATAVLALLGGCHGDIAGREPACVVCGRSTDLELHHLSYDQLGHEQHEDLVPMCHRDHELWHDV